MDLLAELFPRVRAEVLRLLFADAAVELHFRDLVRQSGLSVGTLQTELAKLSANDLVRSERDGNRRYYRANKDHAAYGALQAIVHCALGTPGGPPAQPGQKSLGAEIQARPPDRSPAARPRARREPHGAQPPVEKTLLIGDAGLG